MCIIQKRTALKKLSSFLGNTHHQLNRHIIPVQQSIQGKNYYVSTDNTIYWFVSLCNTVHSVQVCAQLYCLPKHSQIFNFFSRVFFIIKVMSFFIIISCYFIFFPSECPVLSRAQLEKVKQQHKIEKTDTIPLLLYVKNPVKKLNNYEHFLRQ